MLRFFLQCTTALLAAGGLVLPVLAQTPPERPPAPRQHAFIDRFDAANTTHDGHLTLAQAQAAKLPVIVRHFDAIDAQHKGYVTLRDLQAYRQQERTARTQQPRQGE
jgi:hypothetical protein